MKTERDLFKQAYLNLRTSDSIPFPDAVFDEYIRLRGSRGYKLVPVEPTERMLDSAYSSISDNLHYADLENFYKAMIGACDD